MSKLNVRFGAMNCGKSDTMISTAYNYRENGLAVATMMPARMMRVDGFTTSRSGKEWPVDIAIEQDTQLRDSLHQFLGKKALNCLLVDEASFLSKTQVDELEKIAKFDQISVITYGLRSDVQRNLFEGSKRLFELADTIEEIPTMCRCGQKAKFNGRFVDDIFHVGEPIEWVDNEPGHLRYQSMCTECYLENYNQPNAVVA